MFRLQEVRNELAHMTVTGGICNAVWTKWKEVAGIQKYSRFCTKEQWVALCAIVALHRMGKTVSSVTVRVFLKLNGDDPMAFLPGFVSVDSRSLPGSCSGGALPDVIQEWTGFKPSEWTLRRWAAELGLEYSRTCLYSAEQIKSFVRVYLTKRQQKVLRCRSLAESRWTKKTA